MRAGVLAIAALLVATSAVAAQDRRGTRLWNLTANTLTSVQLSPAGANAWGKNQCENDRDGTVDHDERLRITGITTGRYDVKISDKTGRACLVRDIEVKEGQIFTLQEKSLTDCR
jgi:hypothetical protein